MHLYGQISYGQISKTTPQVDALAGELGRTVGSVSRKLANLAALDPAVAARGVKGFSHYSALDAAVWSEFAKDPPGLERAAEAIRRVAHA